MSKAEALSAMNTKEKDESPPGDIIISKSKSRRGRKGESSIVYVKPVFRDEPDLEKLGKALIAMAVHSVNTETEGEQEG